MPVPLRRQRRGASRRTPLTAEQRRLLWRRCGHGLAVVLVLAGLSYGGHWAGRRLLEPTQLPLRHVQLNGELRNLTGAELRAVVADYLGQNFLVLDIEALHAELAAQPWIEWVNVRRRWPDTLEVRLRERTLFGYWGENEMVDVNGQRFRPAQIRQSGPWPRLIGPDGHERSLIRTYRELQPLLRALDLRLEQLTLDERRAWHLQFANGVQVLLGREQFRERLQRFLAAYPRLLANRVAAVAVVDLRYTHGFAVRWKESFLAAAERS